MGQEELQLPPDSEDSSDSLDPSDSGNSGNKPSKQESRRSFLLESIAAALVAGCGNALRGIVSQEVAPQSDFRNTRDGTLLDSREMERILKEFEAQKARIMPKGKEQEQFLLSVCKRLQQNGWQISQDLKDRIISAMEAEFSGEDLEQEQEHLINENSFNIYLCLASERWSVFTIKVFGHFISIVYSNPITGLSLEKRIPRKESGQGNNYPRRLPADIFEKNFVDPRGLASNKESLYVWRERTYKGEEIIESVSWGADEANMITVTRLNGKIVSIAERSPRYGTVVPKGWIIE